MKALISLTALFMIVVACGCLGSSGSSAAPNLAFVYVVGEGSNSISALAEKSTGELTSLTLPAFPTNPRPVALTLTPAKNLLYVANLTSNTVSGFTLDHTTGILTPVGTAVPPTPVCANTSTCSNPLSLGVNSTGAFLFVLNQGAVAPATPAPASISVFSIDATRGLLTPVAGSPFTFASLVAPNPQVLTVSPTAGVLYVSNGPSGTVSAFSIAGSGALTEIAGSPFTAGANIEGITIDPKGQFLYAADFGGSAISSFSIQASGALAAVAGSPFSTGSGPFALATDSKSAFLFSAEQGAAGVSVFTVNAGALTRVTGSPFPLVSSGTPQPSFVVVDVSNTFLYVANTASRNISEFTIKPDGTLVPMATSPFASASGPQAMILTQ